VSGAFLGHRERVVAGEALELGLGTTWFTSPMRSAFLGAESVPGGEEDSPSCTRPDELHRLFHAL